METYESMYLTLYNLLKAIGERSGKRLVSCEYNNEMPAINLLRLQKKLKNCPPTNDQLFKKFPLRQFDYMPPTSNATMKSILKYAEDNRLGVKINGTEIVFQERLSDAELINNRMLVMDMFYRFMEVMKRSAVFASINDKLNSQISIQRRLSNEIYQFGKDLMKVISSDKPPKIKISKVASMLTNFKTEPDERKQTVEYIGAFFAETINNFTSQMQKSDQVVVSYDEIISGFTKSVDLDMLDKISRILNNLRMVNYDEATDHDNIEGCIEVIKAADTYIENSFAPVYNNKNLMISLYRFLKTIHLGLDSKNGIVDMIRSVVGDIKNQFTVSLEGGTINFARVKQSKSIKYQEIIGILHKILVDRNMESINIASIVSSITNGDSMKPYKDQFYQRLAENNVLWSDDYLKTFAGTVMKLYSSTT